jgi:hypothetical protein
LKDFNKLRIYLYLNDFNTVENCATKIKQDEFAMNAFKQVAAFGTVPISHFMNLYLHANSQKNDSKAIINQIENKPEEFIKDVKLTFQKVPVAIVAQYLVEGNFSTEKTSETADKMKQFRESYDELIEKFEK